MKLLKCSCLFVVLLFCISVRTQAQRGTRYDTVVHYLPGTTNYDFVFEGKAQAFAWDTMTPVRMRTAIRTRLHIRNNTGQRLVIKSVYTGDGNVIWDGARGITVPVNSIYELRPIIGHRPGHFYRVTEVSYEKEGSPGIQKLRLHSWGEDRMYLEKPADPAVHPVSELPDTTLHFIRGEYHYFTVLQGRRQSFAWDTVNLGTIDEARQVVLHVLNNSGRSILVKQAWPQDGGISWSGTPNKLVIPGQYYDLKTIVWPGHRRFHDMVHFSYEQDLVSKSFTMPTSGVLWIDDQKEVAQRKVVSDPKAAPKKQEPLTQKPVVRVVPKPLLVSNGKDKTVKYTDTSYACMEWRREGKDPEILYEYKDCRLSTKTSRPLSQGAPLPYTVEKGRFRNDSLLDGTMDCFDAGRHLVFQRKIVRGKKVPAFMYKGRPVNQTDREGRKQGTWLVTGADCPSYENMGRYAECQVCRSVQYIDDVQQQDSICIYRPNGTLSDVYFKHSGLKHPCHRRYYENGFLCSEAFEGDRAGFPDQYRTYLYSDSIAGQLTDLILGDNTKFGYTRGRMSSKTSPRFISIMHLEEPEEKRIPYTVEKGWFLHEKLYNGAIEYYDTFDKLLKTERVVEGKLQH